MILKYLFVFFVVKVGLSHADQSFTIVTGCKDREEHLYNSLSKWVELPNVSEIIIVDWSNKKPLQDLLLYDERIKIVRVENETQWVRIPILMTPTKIQA